MAFDITAPLRSLRSDGRGAPPGPRARPRSDWHPSYGPDGARAPVRDRDAPHRPPRPPARARRHAPRPGELPAATVLVVMVVGLLLAALVNADAMVEQAERKPVGAERDRSLVVWNAVASVAHVLQVSRLRDLADTLAGDDGGPDPTLVTPTPTDPAAYATKPTLRTPTPADKLRMLVAGDSVARDFGEALVGSAEATGVVTATLDYRISSGLARPDYFSWPAELSRTSAALQPDVVVALFGANDAQGMLLDGGGTLPGPSDPLWQTEYGTRVGATMDALRAPGRLVVWVAQPRIRDGGFDADMARIDAVYAAQAATRPWVVFVDSRPVLADDAGGYTDYLPGSDGAPVAVRQGDGIHLSRAGADLLAAAVLDRLRAETGL